MKSKIYVYVLNMRGQPLMPCSPAKARHLLCAGKAKVAKRTPFTIQLKIPTGETKQPITLGVDSGYEHIGLSATTAKVELLSAEVLLRNDVSKLITERKQYRKARRAHKTRYRKCRFLNRVAKFKRNPLAPSIQHKLDSHVRIIQKVANILPITKIVVETANFDIQCIKNPDIQGVDYQRGKQLGFANVRAYILHRDNYQCQHCKGHSKEPRLNVHHIVQRSNGGSDRPDNLITLCGKCHDLHHRGVIKLKVQITKGYRAETFMSIVRKRLILKLQELYSDVSEMFGYITKSVRQDLGLVKSHVNDAYCVAMSVITFGCTANGTADVLRSSVQYLIKQVRKQNRKLFKGKRSEVRNTAPRYLFGFQRYDKVMFGDKECFIFGRRSTGYFELRDLLGNKIHRSAKHSNIKLLESAGTWLWQATHIPPSGLSEGFLRGIG